MTILDLKLDAYKRGFTIIEGNGKSNGSSDETIYFHIGKRDIDGLLLYASDFLPDEVYLNAGTYGDFIRDRMKDIEDKITSRRDQNPNTCQHQIAVVNNKKVCINCTAKLGYTVNVDINFN